jgi:pimeloyl-ACP methyl ester carboxylesterase
MIETSMGTRFSEGAVETGGVRIRYRAAGTGPPVVKLQGTVGVGLTRADDLLADHFRLIVVDVLDVDTSAADPAPSARMIGQGIARLVEHLELERYGLIGTSLGGSVAAWHAIDAAQRVDALVLIAPLALVPEGWQFPTEPVPLSERLLAHPERCTTSIDVAGAPSAGHLAHSWHLADPGHNRELEARLGELTVPTLVMFGTVDRIVPPAMGRIYRRSMPNCNYALVYDAGHAAEVDRPEACAGIVRDFLERHEVFVVSRQRTVINP